MAISTCVVPRIVVPAYSSFSGRNKANKHYTNVALIRSERVSPSIVFPQAKASRTAFEILRTISEKDDEEIQSELNRLQNAYEKLKGFLGDIILVLMAINPFLQCMSDAIAAKNHFRRWSSIGASYGALVMLKECVKIFWKSKPIWVLIIMGFLIYKANKYNIALYKNGRYPIWLGKPLTVLLFGKFVADVILLFFLRKSTPLNIILGSIDIMASSTMFIYLRDDYIPVER